MKERGESALELLEAGLADPDWLFGIRGEGIPCRTFSAENVPTVSAVVLEPEGREKVSITGLGLLERHPTSGSYLPDSDRKAFPTAHAVLHFVILGPLSGQRL